MEPYEMDLLRYSVGAAAPTRIFPTVRAYTISDFSLGMQFLWAGYYRLHR